MGRKPARSVVLCAILAIRTTEDRTPRSARSMTAVSTTLRTRRVPLCSSPTGRAGSSSVAGRPSFPDVPMLPAATSGFPVPASASPYASMTGSSAADAVGVRGRLLEPVEILEVAAAHLRAERGHRRRGRVRPGQAGDLVPGGDELGDDVGTGMAGPASDENAHAAAPL